MVGTCNANQSLEKRVIIKQIETKLRTCNANQSLEKSADKMPIIPFRRLRLPIALKISPIGPGTIACVAIGNCA